MEEDAVDKLRILFDICKNDLQTLNEYNLDAVSSNLLENKTLNAFSVELKEIEMKFALVSQKVLKLAKATEEEKRILKEKERSAGDIMSVLDGTCPTR